MHIASCFCRQKTGNSARNAPPNCEHHIAYVTIDALWTKSHGLWCLASISSFWENKHAFQWLSTSLHRCLSGWIPDETLKNCATWQIRHGDFAFCMQQTCTNCVILIYYNRNERLLPISMANKRQRALQQGGDARFGLHSFEHFDSAPNSPKRGWFH